MKFISCDMVEPSSDFPTFGKPREAGIVISTCVDTEGKEQVTYQTRDGSHRRMFSGYLCLSQTPKFTPRRIRNGCLVMVGKDQPTGILPSVKRRYAVKSVVGEIAEIIIGNNKPNQRVHIAFLRLASR